MEAEQRREYFDDLYAEDEDMDCVEDWEDEDQDPLDEDADALPSLLVATSYSPTRRSRSRSRSPLERVPSALGNDSDIPTGDDDMMEDSKSFYIPDAHSICDASNEIDVTGERRVMDGRNGKGGERIGMRVRGRLRGRSGIRGRGQGRTRRGMGGRRRGVGDRSMKWRMGDPLEIIWTDDDDVPAELREMVLNVMGRRQARAREIDATKTRESLACEVNERESEEAFYDAEDRDSDMLAGDDLCFEWSPDMNTFRKEEVSFAFERTGSVWGHSTAYEAFRSYWDDQILAIIVEQTNSYASKINASAFQQCWVPTNAHEILCLFAFWMMLGIIRMPTINSCFSEQVLLKVDIFRKIFKRNRYMHLVRALQFVEADPIINSVPSTSMSGPETADRMHYLSPILNHLNAKFQANYIPSKDISIDESLTLWKGCLNIDQYIRNKATKFGIKTYGLCEATTGYLWSFAVYTPGYDNDPSILKNTAVVRRLITPLLNKGYRLFMDSWYNSPLLARWLKINGTDCVGTLRPTQSHVPPIINLAQLKQGQLIARHSGDVCVTAWQDKEKIVTISTCHGAETALSRVLSKPPTRPMPFKPQVVLDYSRSMGGVDLKDQMLEPYLLERKRGSKWYMKLFKLLLNCSILNARILLASSTQTNQSHLDFRLSLVQDILNNHLHLCPDNRRTAARVSVDSTRITTNTHWPVHIPQTAADAARNRQSRQKCYVCLKEGRKFQRTPFMCEMCLVPLCIQNCFKSYHVTINF